MATTSRARCAYSAGVRAPPYQPLPMSIPMPLTSRTVLPSISQWWPRQVESAPGKSPRARMLKIADKIANLRSLTESPPLGWSARKRHEYAVWAREVVAACGPTNELLERLFADIADRIT